MFKSEPSYSINHKARESPHLKKKQVFGNHVLLFYVHGKQLRSCGDDQFT